MPHWPLSELLYLVGVIAAFGAFGLTIETVSRTLTQLQGEAVLRFASTRRFRVNDWDGLEALAA